MFLTFLGDHMIMIDWYCHHGIYTSFQPCTRGYVGSYVLYNNGVIIKFQFTK